MNRDTELRLIRESLATVGAARPPADGAEREVPVELYLDRVRYDVEVERFHRGAYNLVAHRSELATPGAFRTMDVVGAPVILVRDDAGRARAFLNVCRHRGATVELREHGQCKRFVCPYHAWTYRTDGGLDHVRHRDGFPSLDVDATSLKELPCVERGPFVWVCPDPDATPRFDAGAERLIDELAGFDDGYAVYRRERRVWRANWKLFVEGGIESYHFKIAHRETIASLFTDTRSTYEVYDGHLRSVLPKSTLAELAERPESEWRLAEHANILYTINPNATALVQGGHYALISMSPVDIDATQIDIATVGRPVPEGAAGEKVRAFLEANHTFTLKTLEEDFRLAEQIQRGLATPANTHLRFATFEGALGAWHDHLDARLTAPDRRTGS